MVQKKRKYPVSRNALLMSNLEADWQNTTSGATPVTQEQKTEATIHTGLPTWDKKKLEKYCLVW